MEARIAMAGVAVRAGVLILLATILVDPSVVDELLARHAMRLVVLLWLVAELGKAFVERVVRGQMPPRRRGVWSALFALVVVVVSLEAVWMFVPRSHGIGYTYASQNWFRYFWRIDANGYRVAPVDQPSDARPRVLVLGDSFAAGHGIRSLGQTFSGQLGQLLEGTAHVVNLGRNGNDTAAEYGDLERYGSKPHAVVLQYYGNDIEGVVGVEETMGSFQPLAGLGWLGKAMVQGSYLLNYLYWLFPHGDASGYGDFLVSAYSDSVVLERHFEDLDRVVRYTEENDMPLLVVVFPFLTDLESSDAVSRPVTAFLTDRDVPVIDVAELIRDLPVKARVVNSNDAHPSAHVHRLVAESILSVISDQEWLTGR